MKSYKNLLFLMAFFCLLCTFSLTKIQAQTTWNGTANISWYAESGTNFNISTAEELAGLAKLINDGTATFAGKTVNLTADIWLNNDGEITRSWTAIGGYPDGGAPYEEGTNGSNKYFEGTFNGNNFIIHNLYCNRYNRFHAGLFAAIRSTTSSTAKLQNIIMVNPRVIARGMAGHVVGFIGSGGAAYIENCLVINGKLEGGTSSSYQNSGSIIGATYPNGDNGFTTYINNCAATGDVFGFTSGGLVGNGNGMHIANSYYAGTMSVPYGVNLGGIAGYMKEGVITNCYSGVNKGSASTAYSGTMKTLAEMALPEFVTLLGDSIYKTDCGLNSGFPILKKMICGVKILGHTNICNGDSTTLTATDWDSYLWNTGQTTPSITVKPNSTTIYSVTGTTGNVSMSDTITVTVSNSIEITGSVTPAGKATVTFPGGVEGNYSLNCGTTTPFNITITPETGWYITKIVVNGETVETFPAQTKYAHTYQLNPAASSSWDVEVFVDDIYTISLKTTLNDVDETPLNGGTLGLVTPWGNGGKVSVHAGAKPSFTFNNTARYSIVEVKVDQAAQGDITSYTFENAIYENHEIHVLYINDCGVKTFPLIENFNTTPTNTIPDCWTRFNTYSTNMDFPYVSAASYYADPNSAYFYAGDTTYTMLVTPLLDADLSKMRVSYALNPENLSGILEVGVIEDILSAKSFHVIEKVPLSNQGQWSERSTYFSDYKGTGKHIAFKWSAYPRALYIDNIKIEMIPECIEPTNPIVKNIGARTALFTWEASLDDALIYDLQLEVGSSVIWSEQSNGISYLLENLTPATTYKISVRTKCANNKYSAWISKTFTTLSSTSDCVIPNMFTLDALTEKTAMFSWVEDGFSSSYNFEYKEKAETTWISEGMLFNQNHSLHFLTPNTDYQVQIRAVCQDYTTSDWSPVMDFRTYCEPHTTLPFMEKFDNTPGGTIYNGLLPSCWTMLGAVGNDRPYVQTQASQLSTDFYSALGALNMNQSVNTTNFVIFPALDVSAYGYNIRDLQVNLWAKVQNPNVGDLILGVMTDPLNTLSFVPVDTLSFEKANTWTSCAVKLNTYMENGNFIAISWKNGGNNNRAYIDDIYVDGIPQCDIPTNFKIGTITTTTAQCSWLDNANSWRISCVPTGIEPDWNESIIITEKEHTFSGLAHNTKYDIYLRAVCNDGSSSLYTMISFSTACAVFTEDMLPYKESFDKYGVGTTAFSPCWTKKAGIDMSSIYIGTEHYSAPGGLYFSTSGVSTGRVTIERFDMDVSQLLLDFKLKGTRANSGVIVGVMTNPNVESTFVPIDTIIPSTLNTWADYTVSLSTYTGQGQYITFLADGFTNDNIYFAFSIDNLEIDKLGTCVKPNKTEITDIQATQATVNWTENGTASQWEIVYGLVDFSIEDGDGIIRPTDNNPTTIIDLIPNTSYNVYVRSNCGQEYSKWSVATTFRTIQIPVSLPYYCDFEDDDENKTWGLLNGSMVNKWCFGEATNNTANGTKGLYISNNDGLNNIYSASTSYVYAIKTLNFADTGFYQFNFDWKSQGQYNSDIGKAFLVPASVELSAGNAFGMHGSIVTTPGGWRDIPNLHLNAQSSWQTVHRELSISQAGIYNLVFFWKNDASGVADPPIAIDNVSIIPLLCPIVSGFTATQHKPDGVTLVWNDHNKKALEWEIRYGEQGSANEHIVKTDEPFYQITNLTPFTKYTATIRALCMEEDTGRWSPSIIFSTTQIPAELPYIHDFEDSEENSNWTFLNANQTNKWTIGSAINNTDDGTKALYVSQDNGATNTYSTTNGSASYIYAIRFIDFSEEGVYNINFDWQAGGESNLDLMRAFIVPSSIIIQENTPSNMDGSYNRTPLNWIDIGGGNMLLQQTWKEQKMELHIANPGIYQLVFFWKNNMGQGNSLSPAVDNITIEKMGCPPVLDAKFVANTTNSATLRWSSIAGMASAWKIQYYPADAPANIQSVTVNNTTAVLTGLASATVYHAIIQSICDGEEDSRWSTPVTLYTKQTPVQIPYIHDFEATAENNNWILINGNQVNKWIINTAVNNTIDGDKSLYISNNNTDNQYSPIISNTYAVRTITFPRAGLYEFAFDWKSEGVSHYDVLRVFLVPDQVLLEADNAYGMIDASNTPPANWIIVDEGAMHGRSTWQNFRTEKFMQTSGTYQLVFSWKNQSHNQPLSPAAVDNISISLICPETKNITMSNITPATATVTWDMEYGNATNWEIEYGPVGFKIGTGTTVTHTGAFTKTVTNLSPSTHYDLYMRTMCVEEGPSHWSAPITFSTACGAVTHIPYQEHFEIYETTGDSDKGYPHCWNALKSGTTAENPYITQEDSRHHGSPVHSLYFGRTSDGYSMAVLPEIAASIPITGLEVVYLGRAKYKNVNGELSIGIMTNPNDAATFVPVSVVTQHDSVMEAFTIEFSEYTGNGRHIAFKWGNSSENMYYIDDVIVRSISPCPTPVAPATTTITPTAIVITWNKVGDENTWIIDYKRSSDSEYINEEVSFVTNFAVDNLSPATNYDIRIRTSCEYGKISKPIIIQAKTANLPENSFTITPTAGTHGRISPASIVLVDKGDDVTFTFIPDEDYKVRKVEVNGNMVTITDNEYTFENVQANATIHVEFEWDIDIAQYNLANKITIYPNPTNHLLYLKLEASFTHFEIVNLLGQKMESNTIEQQLFSIDVANYPAGIYFIRFFGASGVASKRFVKEQ